MIFLLQFFFSPLRDPPPPTKTHSLFMIVLNLFFATVVNAAYGVANQLGYGITLPGASSQHGNGLVKTMPYKKVLRGTGLSRNTKGGGLLLAGEKTPRRRPRIIKADVLHEQVGNGKMVGSLADISTYSFYPAHHITMGEGGALATNNLQFSSASSTYYKYVGVLGGHIKLTSTVSTESQLWVTKKSMSVCR
jgi:hypothetical protein